MKLLKLICLYMFALCVAIALFGCSMCTLPTDGSIRSDSMKPVLEQTEIATTQPTIASTEPQTTAPEDKNLFLPILEGMGAFLCEGNNVTLDDYCSTFSIPVTLDAVTVADLEWDEVPEVILNIRINPENIYGVLVLHLEDGNVWGYTFSHRQLGDIKKDGTFNFSGSALKGVGTLSLSSGTYEYNNQLWLEKNEDRALHFFVSGKEITSEEYDRALMEWHEKEDAEWMPYPMDSYMDLFKKN